MESTEGFQMEGVRPPPPPPPPPPSGPILPSGGWKTTNAPRRDNNPVPSSTTKTRPHVDPQALQHAAARLRKTGYNEQVRGDVQNIPDGRMDRPNQQLSGRDWTNSSQQRELVRNQAGEQIHAPSPHPNNSGSHGDVHRPANPLNSSATSNMPSNRAYYDANSFDATPKSLFKTFNNPSSDSFIDKKLQDSSPSSYSYSSYSSVSTPVAPVVPSTPSSRPWIDRNVPQITRSSFSSTTTSSTIQPQSSPRSSGTSPIRTTLTPRSYSPQKERTTTLEWTSPYVPGQDPRSLIRDYATNTFVREETPSYRSPSPNRQPSPNRPSPVVSRHDQFARQLRDDGGNPTSLSIYCLTASQRVANQYRNPLQRQEVPAEAISRLYQGSYRGDEVDHLVHGLAQRMSTQMRTNVMQSSNICVACHSEISAEKPGCTALDQIFHVACFKCCRCSKVLAGSSFYNIENEPICEGCYQDTLEKCTKCNKTIADKLLRACGGTYHVDCFTCFNCNRILDGIPFTVDSDNNVHCVPCFHDKFAPRCAVCSKGIIPNEGEKESVRVVAMNKSFHVECYKCEDCGLQLSSKIEGQGCYPLDSHLYCKTCNSNRLRMMASTA